MSDPRHHKAEISDYVESIPTSIQGKPNLELNVTSFAGLTEVQESGARMFYWFFEAQNCIAPHYGEAPDQLKPEDIPLLIWLSGGPGAS
ncbi:MAG: hypothetical protein D3924_03785, partial [Candidatus Electrothrix sp. AR4]|nr:hypothetical protein [Candidatus Electrothrix sp. AR4]